MGETGEVIFDYVLWMDIGEYLEFGGEEEEDVEGGYLGGAGEEGEVGLEEVGEAVVVQVHQVGGDREAGDVVREGVVEPGDGAVLFQLGVLVHLHQVVVVEREQRLFIEEGGELEDVY